MFVLGCNLTGEPITIDNFLSKEECDKIIKYGNTLPKIDGMVTSKIGEPDYNKRTSSICWLDPNEDNIWIYNKIADNIDHINKKWFGYDLLYIESLQFAMYESSVGGFYVSHRDTKISNGGSVRKLSFTIQLCDGSDYEGGDLILYETLDNKITMSKAVGSISYFPSYTIHEVKPVTKGTRYSLVGWVSGTSFK
jgi:PKHD-type hydroxylase